MVPVLDTKSINESVQSRVKELNAPVAPVDHPVVVLPGGAFGSFLRHPTPVGAETERRTDKKHRPVGRQAGRQVTAKSLEKKRRAPLSLTHLGLSFSAGGQCKQTAGRYTYVRT